MSLLQEWPREPASKHTINPLVRRAIHVKWAWFPSPALLPLLVKFNVWHKPRNKTRKDLLILIFINFCLLTLTFARNLFWSKKIFLNAHLNDTRNHPYHASLKSSNLRKGCWKSPVAAKSEGQACKKTAMPVPFLLRPHMTARFMGPFNGLCAKGDLHASLLGAFKPRHFPCVAMVWKQ